jgi:ADP-heptose:LPS heptosyltransferase
MPPDLSGVRSILVIKLRAVGDVVLSTIVTKNLRLAFPGARIEYLTEPPSYDVVRSNPFLNGALVYDKKTMSGFDLIRMVRREGFDLVIDLFGNPRTALVTRLSGARIRAGYRFKGRAYAYNVIAEPRGSKVHNSQFNLDAIEALGVEIQDRNIYFAFTPGDAEYADGFMKKAFPRGKPVVCINPGGGWYTKRWGIEKFASLADRIAKEFKAGIVIAWGPGERDDAVRLKELMKKPALVPPPTTLPQLGAMLKRCTLLVTNDSGPMHIAAAVGTPILGIYGPTSPALQGPYGVPHTIVRNEGLTCLGCNYTACPIGHPCMIGLGVDDVMAGVRALLKKPRKTGRR